MTKIDIVSDSPKDAGKTFAGEKIQTPAQYERTKRRRRRSRSSGRSSVTATTPSTPLFSTPTPTPKTSVQDEMKKIDSSSLDVFAKEDAKRRLLGISSGLPTSMQPYTPISQTLLTPTTQKRATTSTSRSFSPALQSTRTPDYGTDYLPLTQTPVPITAPFTPKTRPQLTVRQPKPFTTTKPEDVYKSFIVGERYRKDLADIDKRKDLTELQKEEAKRKLLGISSGFSAKQQAEQRKAELEKAQQENLKNQVIGYRPSKVVSDYDWKKRPIASLDLYNDRQARLRQKAIDGDRNAEASLRGMGQLVTNMPRSLVNEVISVGTFVYTLGKIGVFAVNNPKETASFIAGIDQKTLREADKYARSELSRAGAETGKRLERKDPTLFTDLAAIVAVDYAIAKGSRVLIKPSRKYISSIIDFFKNRGVLLDTRTVLNEVRKFIPAKDPRVNIPTQIRNLEKIENPTRKQVEELTVLRQVEKVDDTIKKLDELIIDNNKIRDRITDPYTPPPRVGRTIKIDVPKINDDVIKLIDDIKKSPIKDIVKSENTRKQIRRLFTQKFPTPPVDRSRQLAKSPKRYTDKQIIDAFYTDGTLFRRIKQDLAKQGIILRTEPKQGFFIDLKTGKRYPNIEVLYIKKDKDKITQVSKPLLRLSELGWYKKRADTILETKTVYLKLRTYQDLTLLKQQIKKIIEDWKTQVDKLKNKKIKSKEDLEFISTLKDYTPKLTSKIKTINRILKLKPKPKSGSVDLDVSQIELQNMKPKLIPDLKSQTIPKQLPTLDTSLSPKTQIEADINKQLKLKIEDMKTKSISELQEIRNNLIKFKSKRRKQLQTTTNKQLLRDIRSDIDKARAKIKNSELAIKEVSKLKSDLRKLNIPQIVSTRGKILPKILTKEQLDAILKQPKSEDIIQKRIKESQAKLVDVTRYIDQIENSIPILDKAEAVKALNNLGKLKNNQDKIKTYLDKLKTYQKGKIPYTKVQSGQRQTDFIMNFKEKPEKISTKIDNKEGEYRINTTWGDIVLEFDFKVPTKIMFKIGGKKGARGGVSLQQLVPKFRVRLDKTTARRQTPFQQFQDLVPKTKVRFDKTTMKKYGGKFTDRQGRLMEKGMSNDVYLNRTYKKLKNLKLQDQVLDRYNMPSMRKTRIKEQIKLAEKKILDAMTFRIINIIAQLYGKAQVFDQIKIQDIDRIMPQIPQLDISNILTPTPEPKPKPDDTPKPKPDEIIKPKPDKIIKPTPDDTIRRPKTPKKPDDTIRRPKLPSFKFKLKPAPKQAREMVKSQLGALQFVIPNPKTKKREVVEIKTGLPYLEAKRIGREITDNLILASFTPIKYGETKKRLSLPKIDMSKFRPRKSKGKVRKFVEKSKYRLDKPLEKKQIQQAKQVKDLVSNKIKQVKREIEKQKAMKML